MPTNEHFLKWKIFFLNFVMRIKDTGKVLKQGSLTSGIRTKCGRSGLLTQLTRQIINYCEKCKFIKIFYCYFVFYNFYKNTFLCISFCYQLQDVGDIIACKIFLLSIKRVYVITPKYIMFASRYCTLILKWRKSIKF